MSVTLYHNPKCSKSRATLALLRENGIEPNIVDYIKQPLNKQSLLEIRNALNCSYRDMMRSGDALFHQLKLESAFEDQLLQILIENPVLMQRPIVLSGKKAAIGRPPEAVLDLFK